MPVPTCPIYHVDWSDCSREFYELTDNEVITVTCFSFNPCRCCKLPKRIIKIVYQKCVLSLRSFCRSICWQNLIHRKHTFLFLICDKPAGVYATLSNCRPTAEGQHALLCVKPGHICLSFSINSN